MLVVAAMAYGAWILGAPLLGRVGLFSAIAAAFALIGLGYYLRGLIESREEQRN